MSKKLMHKLIMYHEIHKRRRDGFKPSQISRHLGLNRRTVRKYLAMSEEEYLEFIHSQKDRDKLLEPYEEFIKARLENCADASAAQVHDWLKEHHNNFIDVNEKTVFNFVLYVRNKYGIPKPFNNRGYEQVEELPFGKQAQSDFGEYNITTDEGKRKKIYFFSMVLSRSRQKFVWFSEHPFTTLAAITVHDKAFYYLEGIPGEIVYDQDTLLLINENKGDLISFKPASVLDEYDVRKDNTISYKGNFYRVPTGTHKPPRTTVWTEQTDDNRLIIYNANNNKIASHKIYCGKGKTIGGSNYKRDFSSGIDQLIDELSGLFANADQVKEYLLKIRHDKPRYIRDQLQHIKKLTGIFNIEVMNQAMNFCIENKIYKATDMESVAKKIHSHITRDKVITPPIIIDTINRTAHKIIPNKSDISDYQSIMT